MTRIQITEDETAALLQRMPTRTVLPMTFGPGWVAIETEDPGAQPALQHLLQLRTEARAAGRLLCDALVWSGPLDAEGHRCHLPEDDEAHDPLGASGLNGVHPFQRRLEIGGTFAPEPDHG